MIGKLVWISHGVLVLVAAVNAAMAIWISPWPLRLFNAAIAVFAVLVFMQSIRVARRIKEWDSFLNPISKSSLPNLRPPSSPSLPSLHPPASPSANPYPHLYSGYSGLASKYGHPPVRVEQPVIGFRSWRVVGTGLGSVNEAFGCWSSGVNEAVCLGAGLGSVRLAVHHDAPDWRCTCGLYCYHAPSDDDEDKMGGRIGGAVVAWGRIVRHQSQGFRAQFMRVLALASSERDRLLVFYRYPWKCDGALDELAASRYLTTAGMAWSAGQRVGEHIILADQTACVKCGEQLLRRLSDEEWDRHLRHRTALAKAQGVPLVPYDALASYASEFGQSIRDLEYPLNAPLA